MWQANGVKAPIMQVTYFLMAPWLICCFTVILLTIDRKWLLKKSFTTVLLLKSKLSGKSQHFNTIDRSIEMLKIKTFYEPQNAISLKEIIMLSTFLEQNFPNWYLQSYRGNAFQVLRECIFWASMQHNFCSWYQPETCFWLCCGSIFFIMLSK